MHGYNGAVGERAARCRRAGLMLAAVAAGAALSALVLRESAAVRVFEAWLSGAVIPALTGLRSGAVPHAPIVWFATGPRRYLGLFISSECTVDPLVVPFIVATAVVAWWQGAVVRPLSALALAAGLLLGMNQLRLLVIIVLTARLGPRTGFYWGHGFTGSLIAIFGAILTFFVYVLIAVRRKRPGRHRQGHRNQPGPRRAG